MPLLKIIGLCNGAPSEFDGKYVAAYDPSYHPVGEEYDGGLLEVTDDPAKALQFATAGEAMGCWQRSYGTRSDGKPNRPLTAWTVEIS